MRSAVVAAVLASALALSACGSAPKDDASTGGQAVRAQDGAFTTIAPPGFDAAAPNAAAAASQPELVLHRQAAQGDVFTAIIVTAPPHTSGTLEQQVAKTRREFAHAPDTSKVSAARKLTIDGEPALAFTFVAAPKDAPPTPSGAPAPVEHAELVTVIHGGRTHTILYGAPPSMYDALHPSLDLVLQRWKWSK